MSSAENPYQSPTDPGEVYVAEEVAPELLWRKGSILVMQKTATLPDRCVKSNLETARKLKRTLSWHHPAIFLAILASILIYIVLALILRKTATIQIGLSDEWFRRRLRSILIGWAIVFVSVGMVIGAFFASSDAVMGWLILSGIFLFFVGAIYGLTTARMVAAVRIDDSHVWLKGVCDEYLEGLPVWPHHP